MRARFAAAVMEALEGEGISPVNVRQAAGSVLQRLPDGADSFTEADVGRAVRRAKRLERLTPAGGEDPEPGEAIVPPGPSMDVLARQRADVAEPFVRSVREEVFGSPAPPFESMDDPDAVAWEEQRARQELDRWAKGGDVAPGLDRLDAAARKVSEGAGFRYMDVLRWIYTGERPDLRRAVLRVNNVRRRLPDGAELRRREVNLTLHAPIPEREIRQAWRRVQRAWRVPPGTPVPPSDNGGRVRGVAVTELDEHLHRIVQAMPDATWPERRDRWCEVPPEGWSDTAWQASEHVRGRSGEQISADALRMRWRRLQEKIESMEPEEEESNASD